MNDVTIDLASPDDVPALAELRWQLYAEYQGLPTESPEVYRERFTSFASKALASDDWRCWVARDRGRIVGAMWLQRVPRVPIPGKYAGPIGYLTNVYVAPEHRNTGVGSSLLERIASWCREQGYSLVIVWPTQRSRPFYGRGGFEQLDEPLVLDLGPDAPLPD